MPSVLENWIKNLTQIWAKWNTNQRVLFMITVTVMLSLVATGVYLAAKPDYTLLYTNVSPQDANAIVEHLKEKRVPYRLVGGGSQIEVPSRSVYDLRIELAGKGLPQGQGVGFEIFDKMSFGVTDEVQKINYLRAIQNELEKTIDSLVAVEKSRVHLVMPKEDYWFEEPYPPSASVMLKLANGGSLSPQQIQSIRFLLASAVRGLQPERITIVDTQGKVLSSAEDPGTGSGLSERQIDYKKKVEDYLRQAADSLLTEILGPGRAAVRVQAEVDFDQITKEREYFEPVVGKKGLIRSEKMNSVQPTDTTPASGGPAGTASNLQGYPPSGYTAPSASSKNEKQVSYEMNRTIERVTTASGTVRKLSVGIFVDGTYPPEKLADIQSVLSRALGIDTNRGDLIEVKAFAFNRKDLEQDKQLLEKSQREKFWLTLAMQWGPRTLLVLLALGLLVAALRGGNRYLQKMVMAPANGKYSDKESMQTDKILSLIKQNPADSAQILKHWLS